MPSHDKNNNPQADRKKAEEDDYARKTATTSKQAVCLTENGFSMPLHNIRKRYAF